MANNLDEAFEVINNRFHISLEKAKVLGLLKDCSNLENVVSAIPAVFKSLVAEQSEADIINYALLTGIVLATEYTKTAGDIAEANPAGVLQVTRELIAPLIDRFFDANT